MPKYSPKQEHTFVILTDSLAAVATLANDSTETDKALLAIANRAAHFASVWLRCNTESDGRGEMRANARALVERATTDSHTPVAFAFMALGKAYQQFGSCEYREANKLAAAAVRLAAVPVVQVCEIMARA